MRSQLIPSVLALLLVFLAGCGPNTTPTSITTAAGAVAPGGFVITKDFGLAALDNSGGHLRTLVPMIDKSLMRHPAWSPDGRLLAYAVMTPTGPQGLPEADLYVANADGSGGKLLVKHDQPGASLIEPAWSPDGKTLYFSYIGPTNKDKPLDGFRFEIQRVALTGGTAETVVREGSSASLSRDGKWLSYVAPSQKTQEYVLFVSTPDGSNPRQLTKEGDFILVFAPKLNSAGTQVVFAAAGSPPNMPPSTRPTPASRSPLERLLGTGVAEADGAPMEIWKVNVDGTGLTRLTNLFEDSPYPAWSADGGRIAFFGIGGIYVMDADGANLKKLTNQVSHGEMDWRSG